MPDRVRVLFLASNPYADTAPLRLDEEVRRIDLALRKGRDRDSLELVSQFAARAEELQDALLRHAPHVVHFAGHGLTPGIVLGDEHGRPHTVTAEALRGLFGILKGSVRAVVLNGCQTLPTVEALAEVVDVAIGMDRPVLDATAIAFAESFYGALAMGRTLLTAYEMGVNQLRIVGLDDGAVPVLRVRPGADPDAPLATAPAPGIGGGAPHGTMTTDTDTIEAGTITFVNRREGGTADHRVGRISADDVRFQNG